MYQHAKYEMRIMRNWILFGNRIWQVFKMCRKNIKSNDRKSWFLRLWTFTLESIL